MGVNKVILVGHLGKDPELRYTQSQTPVANFSLATTEKRKDPSGNWVDNTEWHNIVTFGKTAENCSNFIKKGRQVYIEGRIQTRKWTDKEGKDRWTTEIVANTVQFLGSKGDGAGGGNYVSNTNGGGSSAPSPLDALPSADTISSSGSSGASSSGDVSFEDDDIPF